MKAVWHDFAERRMLAETLADAVAERLEKAVAARGAATIAVSGGSTPPPFFKALSQRKIDWARVTVTLVDERFVPPSSDRSNARLAAQHLLQNEAARAAFVGLYHDTADVEAAAAVAEQEIATLRQPLDVVVLGMGTDGHTASFFPDAGNLDALLDPQSPRHVLPVHAPSAVEPRLTLSMPVLCPARHIVLHIEGEEKKRVLEAALAAKDGPMPPVRAVIENAAQPVHIYWAAKKDSKP